MMKALCSLAIGFALSLTAVVTAAAQGSLNEKLIDQWLTQGQTQPESTAPAAAPTYEELVAQVKSGNTGIDFTRLRLARTDVANFNPDVGVPDSMREELTQAMAANDLDKVMAVANRMLEGHYTDVLAHIALATIYERRGERARMVFEQSVAQGLVRSIGISGAGTLESPYRAINVDEPYNFIYATGHRIVSQDRLLRSDAEIDVFEVVDQRGQRKTLHFDMKLADGAVLRQLIDKLKNVK
jgi:hypothetical protein